MEPSITIRIATITDAPAIAALSQELGYPADAAEMGSRLGRILGRADQLVLVAETADGGVCSWLQATSSDVLESGFRVEIVGLVVSPFVRRHGIGKKLVTEAENWGRYIGARSVIVSSNVIREESHIFYPALGYTAVKVQRVYRKKLEGA